VAGLVRSCQDAGLVDRALVLDGGSTDGTPEAARRAGLTVLAAADLAPGGPAVGKGGAVARLVAHLRADHDAPDVLVLVDGDVVGLGVDSVAALLAPLADPRVALVKGVCRRIVDPASEAVLRPGRVSELVARPALALLSPALAGLTDPLSGQVAVRLAALEGIDLADGYGLELAMLLAVEARHGADAIVEVALEPIRHRHKDVDELVPVARDVMAVIVERARRSAPPLDRHRPRIMGILNVNPDSFSDPRASLDVAERVEAGIALARAGADIVDVGAQSASPATPVLDADREIALLLPVLAGLHEAGVVTSVDTYKARVAAAVIDAGTRVVNDYSGLSEPEVAALCARGGADLVLTHNIGRVKERLTRPDLYGDVVAEVGDWFEARLRLIEDHGLAAQRVWLDPGIDLSKTPAQSIAVLRGAAALAERFGRTLLVAVSRKDFIGALTPSAPRERDPGTLAAVAALTRVPDVVVRVHDVAATAQFLTVLDALERDVSVDESMLLDPALYRQPSPRAATSTARQRSST
jgi:dihydropteroate synthase